MDSSCLSTALRLSGTMTTSTHKCEISFMYGMTMLTISMAQHVVLNGSDSYLKQYRCPNGAH